MILHVLAARGINVLVPRDPTGDRLQITCGHSLELLRHVSLCEQSVCPRMRAKPPGLRAACRSATATQLAAGLTSHRIVDHGMQCVDADLGAVSTSTTCDSRARA